MIAFLLGLTIGATLAVLIMAAVITGANPVPRIPNVQRDIDLHLATLAQQGPFPVEMRWSGHDTEEGWE